MDYAVGRRENTEMLERSALQTIICTSDIERSIGFYSEVLGLPQKGSSHGAAIFDVGGKELRVSPVPETSPTEHTVLGFAVENIESVVAALSDKGVLFERFPDFPHNEDGILVTSDGARVAWVRDPDGNLLSIVQYE